MPATTRQPHFALLLGLAWLLAVVQLVAQHWAVTAQTLLDTDDAMRLVQMRDWLAGQGWYDLTQRRLAGGYKSHWSRLIDAGLAGTLRVFSLFTEPAMAERLMRTVWPMLWLLPTMGGAAAIAWRIAGRDAALIALLLGVLGFHALYQFRPGRIDHHNVQIALSMLLVAATVWSDRARWAAAAAGAITGLALAIGLECLPYLVVCGAAFALRYTLDASAARAARDYGLALTVSSLVGFFAVVGPAHWSQGVLRRHRHQLGRAGRHRRARPRACRTMVASNLARSACRSDRHLRRGGLDVPLARAELPARALRADDAGAARDLARPCAGNAAVAARAGKEPIGSGRDCDFPGGRAFWRQSCCCATLWYGAIPLFSSRAPRCWPAF